MITKKSGNLFSKQPVRNCK